MVDADDGWLLLFLSLLLLLPTSLLLMLLLLLLALSVYPRCLTECRPHHLSWSSLCYHCGLLLNVPLMFAHHAWLSLFTIFIWGWARDVSLPLTTKMSSPGIQMLVSVEILMLAMIATINKIMLISEPNANQQVMRRFDYRSFNIYIYIYTVTAYIQCFSLVFFARQICCTSSKGLNIARLLTSCS